MADTEQQGLPWRFLGASLALHVLLFVGLVVTLPKSQVRLTQSSVNIVQAVAIDESKLATQIAPIQETPSTETEPVVDKPPETLAANQPEPSPNS
jgi:hypothetical protein